MGQPDFAALWRNYFDGKQGRIRYELRRDSNRLHDLIFISSLIHDARFKREDVDVRGKQVSIHLERDRWELLQSAKRKELRQQAARVTIFPVYEVEWWFKQGTVFGPQDVLSIDEISIERQRDRTRNQSIVTIHGLVWRCQLAVDDMKLQIRLHDV